VLKKAAAGFALFLASLYVSWGLGVNPADEAWFLQVLRRIYQGETLYRDVFFGTPPLSVYVSMPFLWVLGPEILVVKLVSALSYACLLLLGWQGLSLLGAGPSFRLAFVALSLALAPPFPTSPYHLLAMAGFMGSLVAFVACAQGRPSPGVSWASLAGFSAGLAFLAKHNVGALALAAGLVAFLLAKPQPVREVVRCGLAFGITSLAGLVPVVLQGAGGPCLEYLVFGKGNYLKQASLPYFGGLGEALEKAGGALHSGDWRAAVQLGQLFAYTLPLVVGVGWLFLVFYRWRGWQRLPLALGVFLLAAWAGIYPRFDLYHVLGTLPVFLFALVILTSVIWKQRLAQAPGARVWVLAVGAALALALVGQLVLPVVRLARGDLVLALRPHFRGALLPASWVQKAELQAPRLRALASNSPGFLLSPFAGFWYLAADIQNPTPFDYPMSTAFGRHGEEQVVHALENGHIGWVCWQEGSWPLKPQRLERYLAEAWQAGEDLGDCRVYRPRLPSSER